MPLPTHLTRQQAIDRLKRLVGQDIFVSVGYGGVLFIELQNVQKVEVEYHPGKITPRYFGEYRIFANDDWVFHSADGRTITRWESSSSESDSFFKQLGVQELLDVEVQGTFEKTTLVFGTKGSKEQYRLTILRDDSVRTFTLSSIPDQEVMTVYGQAKITLQQQQVTAPEYPKTPRPPKSPTVEVSRDFLRDCMPEFLPISLVRAQQFLEQSFNQPLQHIEVESATRFSLQYGPQIGWHELGTWAKLDSSSDQDMNELPAYRWEFQVEELWRVEQKDQTLIDAQEYKFAFAEPLRIVLQDKIVQRIELRENGQTPQLHFDGETQLRLLSSNRYASWSWLDRESGLSISYYRDHGLVYRVTRPLFEDAQFITREQSTEDVHLDALLEELNFYRKHMQQE